MQHEADWCEEDDDECEDEVGIFHEIFSIAMTGENRMPSTVPLKQ